MKTNILLFLLAFALQAIFAQSPALINYQAVVRDANGNLITSGTISLGISIHDAIVGGNQLYFETHNGITPNAFGVVNVLIGGGTVISGNFLLINWGNGNKYLQVYVNSNPIGSRTQMVSVPYALYANKAANADSATYSLNATTAATANVALSISPPIVTGLTDYLLAYEWKPNGVECGGVIPATFTKRGINRIQTLVGNAISFDSVANTITLNQNGTYYIKASAPCHRGDKHQLVIRDVNTSAVLITGTSERSSDSGLPDQTTSIAEGYIIVSNITTFKLDHFINTNGPGGIVGGVVMGASSVPASGLIGIYAKCFVQKIQ